MATFGTALFMKYFSLILILFCFISSAFGWGFFAHRKINEHAVYTLPPEMFGFFKSNIRYLVEHAVDADKRRYLLKEEIPRHYIDADHYGLDPFGTLPINYKDAVLKYSEDTLLEHGINPWHIMLVFNRLTAAFRSGDGEKILKNAADLGHYVGDAHVPLHTTQNYNGQLTGQHGIHAFWESRLPELFFQEFDLLSNEAVYLDHPEVEVWKAVKRSHELSLEVLESERELNLHFAPDQKYQLIEKNHKMVKNYSEEYSRMYLQKLNGMVEKRMRESINLLGSLWYTAWINAGNPELENLKTEELKNESSFDWFEDFVRKLKGHDEF